MKPFVRVATNVCALQHLSICSEMRNRSEATAGARASPLQATVGDGACASSGLAGGGRVVEAAGFEKSYRWSLLRAWRSRLGVHQTIFWIFLPPRDWAEPGNRHG